MIKQFFPIEKTFLNIQECVCQDFSKQKVVEAFSSKIVGFLDSLSKQFLADPKTRAYPELIAFAFWIRRASIMQKIDSISYPPLTLAVPRGVAFHIAPSNVDIMFLYSWVISLLAGNINIIRISQTETEITAFILNNLRKIVLDEKYDFIAINNKIITYEKMDDINIYLSLISDLRILWGGDQTVESFKALPTQAHCKDISFSDKLSYSVINSSEYLNSNLAEAEMLADNFFNDSFWFDQMGCSSPQIIFFVGDVAVSHSASQRFKLLLDQKIFAKGYSKQTATLMDQLTNWYEFASKGIQDNLPSITNNSSTFVEVSINEIDKDYKTCGGGFFIICYIDNLDKLNEFNSRKHQTLGYYGFGREELIKFVQLKGANTPYRLVQIGKALDFDVIWDGYNLFYEFIKVIKLC